MKIVRVVGKSERTRAPSLALCIRVDNNVISFGFSLACRSVVRVVSRLAYLRGHCVRVLFNQYDQGHPVLLIPSSGSGDAARTTKTSNLGIVGNLTVRVTVTRMPSAGNPPRHEKMPRVVCAYMRRWLSLWMSELQPRLVQDWPKRYAVSCSHHRN